MSTYSKISILSRLSKVFRFLLLSGLFIPATLYAQEEKYQPYQVEDVTPEDFTITNDIIDENSPAVYIFELGDSNIKDNITEWVLEYTRSFRIKILTEQGLSLADQIVILRVRGKNIENIGRVKGGVYNLVNGKVEFEKLKNSDWFEEDVDQKTKRARMTFKNVKVGSIIELSYTIFSPIVTRIKNWEFQHDDIPVLYSEYYIRYPQSMGYKILQFGYHPLSASAHTVETETKSGVGISTGYNFKEVYVLACENVPAMRDEPLMDSPENYRSKVIVELNYVDYPDLTREFIYKDWGGSAKKFLEEGFNDQYMNPKGRLGYFTLDSANCESLTDSVRVIYDEISKHYTSSEEINYITPQRNPRQVLASNKATACEINWILVSTLRANSINAFPVLVSTRSNQRIIKEYPLFSQYSGFLAAVKSGDEFTLLDASTSELEPGEIPGFYYNGEGLLLNKEQPEWIPIVGNTPTSENCTIEFQGLDDGLLSGEMRLRVSGLYRFRLVKDLLEMDEADISEELNLVKNAKITLNKEKSDFDANPMDIRFDISINLEKFGNSYLLPAVIYDDMSNNVLKDKDRRYPVNYPDSWTESYTCLVHLDAAKYDVTLPENANFILPDQDGKFSFMGSYNFGSLVIRNKVEINKTTFSPNEYPTLRQFYDLISATHSSFIEITEK